MKFYKKKCKIYDIGILLISLSIILLFLNYNKKLREEKKNEHLKKQEIQLKNFSEFYLKEYKENIENIFEYFYEKADYDKLSDEGYSDILIKDWEKYKEKNPYIKWIYIAYADNLIVIDRAWKKPESYQMIKKSWYKNGIKNDNLAWSEPYEDVVSKKVYIAITKPIKDKRNQVKALFGMDINLEELSNVISSFDINQENFIYDKNFKIVAHTNQALLNKNVKDLAVVKEIEISSGNRVYDDKSNVYVYYKSDLGWTIVKKIPKDFLYEEKNKVNQEKYLYISIYFLLIITLHFLYISKRKKEVNYLFKALRAVQNRENLDIENIKSKGNENLFQEIYNIQKIIENLEKETYKDRETELYSINYFIDNVEEFMKVDKKILLLNYKNLPEIKNQYGKNIVELVLKRGAITLNALKEIDELALRIDRETLGIILNSNEIEKKSNYIISEILNYRWKMHNIHLKLSWEILSVEEYYKEISKELIAKDD